MANYRLPGPMCSWSQNLVVDDGTSALSPGCRPGPIDGAAPGHASELDPRTLWRRASAVQEACRIALIRAPEAIVRATGLDDLPALAKRIVEGVVLAMLAVVGASTALGGGWAHWWVLRSGHWLHWFVMPVRRMNGCYAKVIEQPKKSLHASALR